MGLLEKHGRRRLVRRLVVGVAALAVVALAPWGWVWWTSRDHVYAAAEAPSAPVALVLGAGLWADGSPSPYLAARLDVARELYAVGKVRVILVSGDNSAASYDEPTAMRDYLVAHGIPDADVVRDFAGRDTYDSCSRARRIFGVSRLLVVSQGYHVPRAVATCRALGLDVDGVGDWSVEPRWPSTWAAGSLREKAAALKTVWDVTSGRDPILGPKETSVEQALARPR